MKQPLPLPMPVGMGGDVGAQDSPHLDPHVAGKASVRREQEMDVIVAPGRGGLTVTGPYDPEFAAQARQIGGRRIHGRHPAIVGGEAWRFDRRDDELVRGLVGAVYGVEVK